jgi:uncharacterized coiled-coil protein SlyX
LDEKKVVQQIHNDKIRHESYLAFQDAVIEELETNVEESYKKDVAQQDKTKKFEVLIEKLIGLSVAIVSVVMAGENSHIINI